MIKISRWEDLIGLENGKGLRIEKINNGLSEVLYGEECIKRLGKTIKLSITVNKLKAMGFELEYINKVTEDEILNKYRPNKFKKGVYEICILHSDTGYTAWSASSSDLIGYCYYDKETAKKILEELNE